MFHHFQYRTNHQDMAYNHRLFLILLHYQMNQVSKHTVARLKCFADSNILQYNWQVGWYLVQGIEMLGHSRNQVDIVYKNVDWWSLDKNLKILNQRKWVDKWMNEWKNELVKGQKVNLKNTILQNDKYVFNHINKRCLFINILLLGYDKYTTDSW